MMIQLYQPLNFMGMVYREIKQAVIDIEKMFAILGAQARDRGQAGRAAARRRAAGAIRFENVSFAYEPDAADPQGPELRGAGRPHGGDRRPVGRRQVDDLAAAVPLLRGQRRAHLDRRPGHPRRDAEVAARGDRHGPAGHRAVQRHHPLQHPLRPLGGDRRGGRGGGAARADRRLHPHVAARATRPRSASAA